MRSLVYLALLAACAVVVECKCIPVFSFKSANEIKLETLHKKLISAAVAHVPEIERSRNVIQICKPRNPKTMKAFSCRLREMEEDHLWVQQFGVHEKGDIARWTATIDSGGDNVIERQFTESWSEALNELLAC